MKKKLYGKKTLSFYVHKVFRIKIMVEVEYIRRTGGKDRSPGSPLQFWDRKFSAEGVYSKENCANACRDLGVKIDKT